MSSWFQDRFSHTGKATLEFESPRGSVSGEGSVEVDERGAFTVSFQVQDFEYQEVDEPEEDHELLSLLTGNTVTRADGKAFTQISFSSRNTCTSFRLETPEGVVRATGSITYWIGNDDHGQWRVSVYPLRLQYDVSGKEHAAYWVMPLSNFAAGFLQKPSPDVEAHPLLRIRGDFSLIEFDFNDGKAFIERVPEYEKRVEELQEGRGVNHVTSVMVGPVGDEAHDSFEALEEWIPLHLLGVLGMATGLEVGSPQIELRGEDGELVRRFYVSPTPPVYITGHKAVYDTLGRERLGPLLSAASLPESAAKLNESYLRVTIKLMIRAKLRSATVEDGLAYATRAVDGLCQEFELQKRPSVKEVLGKTQAKDVNCLLADAAKELRNMAQDAETEGESSQAEVLGEIANKTPNVVSLTQGFNKAIVALLEKFDLPDERIVSPFIAGHERFKENSFGQAVAAYRGRALHVNYLGITRGDLSKAYNAIILTNHLHDILLRIVFKTIGYSGSYNPTVSTHRDDQPVDWVNDKTTPRQLGYERFD